MVKGGRVLRGDALVINFLVFKVDVCIMSVRFWRSHKPHGTKIYKQLKREDMVKEFNYKGHHFKVAEIEGSTDCIIIRDGRQTRRVKEEIAQRAVEYVDKLFM